MASSAFLKLVLPLVIIIAALSNITPVPTAKACSCRSDIPRIALEQQRQAVLVHAIGQRGDNLVYVVESAYGINVPEQLILPIDECDPAVVNGDSIGFSIVEYEGSLQQVVCSSANLGDFLRLANQAGLVSRPPVPVANLLYFDANGVEIAEPEPLAESLASGDAVLEKDLVDPLDRQPSDQSAPSSSNGVSLVLIALAAAVVIVLLVTTLTNKRAR